MLQRRVVNPKKVRTRWIWAPAGLACATTNPAGWLFGPLFFVSFFCGQKKEKEEKRSMLDSYMNQGQLCYL
jgi:hypothetical protein